MNKKTNNSARRLPYRIDNAQLIKKIYEEFAVITRLNKRDEDNFYRSLESHRHHHKGEPRI